MRNIETLRTLSYYEMSRVERARLMLEDGSDTFIQKVPMYLWKGVLERTMTELEKEKNIDA